MEALKYLAQGGDMGQALLQAIADKQFLLKEVEKGSKILIEQPDKTRRRVLLR